MAYTLADLVRLTARRNAVSPALTRYEMDDAFPSRREVVSLSADIQYAVLDMEKRLVLWMLVAMSACTLMTAFAVYGLLHL